MNPTRIFAKKKSTTEGELHLYGNIGASFFSEGVEHKTVVDLLKKLVDDGAKSLTIYINSPGGSVFEGLAIYNSIKRFDGQKTVIVDALAGSIASIIAMAGDDIQMNTGSMMMIHEPSTFAAGKAKNMKDAASKLEKISNEMAAIYASRTGRPEKEIRDIMDAETWMTSKEAVKEKFANSVLPSADTDEQIEMRMVASATPLLATYRNLPDSLRAMLARGYNAPPVPERQEPPPEERNMSFEIFARALGLSADASEAAILAAITELRAKLSAGDLSVLALTSKTTAEEARGVLMAWKSSHEKVGTLTEQLAVLEGAQRSSKVTALVEAAIKDGKIPPAMKDFWMAEGNKSVTTLEAFCAAAPKLVPGTGEGIVPKPVDPAATGIVAVSPEEQEKIFASLGIKDEAGKKAVRDSVGAQNTMLAKHGVRLPTAFVQ